jgi:hypothetical protein
MRTLCSAGVSVKEQSASWQAEVISMLEFDFSEAQEGQPSPFLIYTLQIGDTSTKVLFGPLLCPSTLAVCRYGTGSQSDHSLASSELRVHRKYSKT